MKKIFIAGIATAIAVQAMGQNIYKTNFSNTPGNRVEIRAGSEEVIIVGHDRDEIIIETTVKPSSKPAPIAPRPHVQDLKMSTERSMNQDDRAKGLKPLTPSGSDNTGVGLTIEKTDTYFTVMNVSSEMVEGKFVFRIPNKVNLTINEMKPWAESSYKISGINGELNVNALNSGFVISEVTGPVVMQNTNGSIEIAFNRLAPEKPNSLTTVNGFIDITLPGDAKADFKINAINGEAFTDFDIKTEAGKEGMPPIPHFKMFNMHGSINGGGVPFTVSAVNGDVYIRKRK